MKTQFFTLPEWEFVSGETQTRTFRLYEPDGASVMNLQGASSEFALNDFVNPDGDPILPKSTEITEDDNGKACLLTVHLDVSDTINLDGKYIYQLTVHDLHGNTSAPQGIMRIHKNIDRSFTVGG